MQNFFYKVNDKEYEVEVIYRKTRNSHYRFRNQKFIVSCPYFTPKYLIVNGLDKFAEKLIKMSDKELPFTNEYIYIFGNKYLLSFPGRITISNYPEIIYQTSDELKKKLKQYFKQFITNRVRYYESIMSAPIYQVGVQEMTSRFGSNSIYSKKLNFAFSLIHFSIPIIDSVIVHEIAHIFVYNHSNKFYDVVYKYCPKYDIYRRHLIKGIYHD